EKNGCSLSSLASWLFHSPLKMISPKSRIISGYLVLWLTNAQISYCGYLMERSCFFPRSRIARLPFLDGMLVLVVDFGTSCGLGLIVEVISRILESAKVLIFELFDLTCLELI
ncbi:hypothetical protein HAX54_044819, partial [Datura stramonium]|nr:hypothetical protein [Datura stramonium]